TAYFGAPADSKTFTLLHAFKRVPSAGFCARIWPTGTVWLNRLSDTRSSSLLSLRTVTASAWVLPTRGGTLTSVPEMANLIAVIALTPAAIMRMAIINARPESWESLSRVLSLTEPIIRHAHR